MDTHDQVSENYDNTSNCRPVILNVCLCVAIVPLTLAIVFASSLATSRGSVGM